MPQAALCAGAVPSRLQAAGRPGQDDGRPRFSQPLAFAPGIRKIIYTTNAVEALNRSLRKIIKTRGSFPNEDAALKLLYLAIRNAGMRWRRSTEWTAAMGQFAILFGARFPGSAR
jgi:putative transposase